MQGDFAVYLLEITATDRATGGQARSSSIQVCVCGGGGGGVGGWVG